MHKIAVIPVRSGSKRLPKKNYKAFNFRTLAEIARDKCLAAGIFDKIVISSDDPVFEELANSHEVEFLLRSQDLAGDNATTDAVMDLFFEKFSSNPFFGSIVLALYSQSKILKIVDSV